MLINQLTWTPGQGWDTVASSDETVPADVVRRRYGLLDGRQAKLADIAAIWGITSKMWATTAEFSAVMAPQLSMWALGTTRMWVGAWGAMSRKAMQRSSS